MKKIYLLILSLPFFVIGCASQPHRPESTVTRLDNGNTQVQIKLHEDDIVSKGSKVNAYEKECRTIVRKNIDSYSCIRKLAGQGEVVAVTSDKLSTVEFAAATRIDSEMEFEVSAQAQGGELK